MSTYQVNVSGNVMQLAFGEPASNSTLVQAADARLEELRASGALSGGPLLKITGPASLPIMAVITHKVAHLYGAIAIFDPKMEKFVVSISHHPDYATGQLLD